jgi:sulfonate transport system ATP-binding protein
VIVGKLVTGTHISIQNVTKTFGDLKVLENISLEIDAGTFIAIVGHSGCGKSTLLRMIAGLETVSGGVIALDGKPVVGIDPDVRMLFQESRLLPWKKVIDNVKIGTAGAGEEKSIKALKSVGLDNRKDDWPYVLSGGQKQRVSLARALASKPKLLLLDEPLGALDALTRIEMQALIEKIWLENGFTGILVTHDVSEAVALADSVIFIDEHTMVMDVKISLSRPRERNSDFSYFEKHILDRVMYVNQVKHDTVEPQHPAYSI